MLAIEVAALVLLGIVFLVLTLRAKRFDYERFRTIHSRRKYRVPVQTSSSSTGTESDEDKG